MRPVLHLKIFGAWRSLEARAVRDRKVGGSNPLAPTIHFTFHARWSLVSPLAVRCSVLGEMRIARRFLISGIVQGVGFRYFAYKAAQRCNISGAVRNLSDGRVAIVAEGEEADMRAFLAELRQGPRLAIVEDIEIEELKPGRTGKGFQIEG